jgi:alkaline phosphatase D
MRDPTPTRRAVVRAALALAAAAVLRPGRVTAAPPPRFIDDPFALGIASGAPRADGVSLWTRLAPAPFDPTGGMTPDNVGVKWEVAEDEAFKRVVAADEVTAFYENAHSVRADVFGLEPGRWYHYRFTAGKARSPVGRTRTAEAAGAPTPKLRFGVASCQHFEHGWYVGHRHLLADDPDLVLFLGDYIYEKPITGDTLVRRHFGEETTTLGDYRVRHAQYKTDRDLQALHANVPWCAVWDDHEVDNDWAADQSEHLDPQFLGRRAAAFQAYLEHMPFPTSVRLRNGRVRLHHDVVFGDLAHFVLLDDRQYRSPQACPDPAKGGGSTSLPRSQCVGLDDPDRTLLGAPQRAWLDDLLRSTRARWTVLAQQSLVAPAGLGTGPDRVIWTDGWDGYPAERAWLTKTLAKRRPPNPIVLGGDIHASVVADLHRDPDDPGSEIVASELCGTSLTSAGDDRYDPEVLPRESPSVRYANYAQRGYALLELSRDRCDARFRVVDEKDSSSDVSTSAGFTVEAGRLGAQRS